VLPPETSAHVQGLAIDVGATQGAYWLAEHGLEFGLCQTYANEVWHFEKLPDGADTCPEQHPDSSWGW
jgi:LAS superfamily LD-carboxypeptidase LdcB